MMQIIPQVIVLSLENEWFKLITHSPSQVFRDSLNSAVQISICILVSWTPTMFNILIHLGIPIPAEDRNKANAITLCFKMHKKDIIYT